MGTSLPSLPTKNLPEVVSFCPLQDFSSKEGRPDSIRVLFNHLDHFYNWHKVLQLFAGKSEQVLSLIRRAVLLPGSSEIYHMILVSMILMVLPARPEISPYR